MIKNSWRKICTLHNHFYMAASLLIRMSIGLIVFVLLARGLGPQRFGFMAAVFAYATLASLLTDFGFGVKTLRDIAATPERGAAILNASLNVKGLLTAVVLVVGAVVVLALPIDIALKAAAIMLGAGLLVAAFGDLSLIAFRALGRFAGETRITLWTSASYLVLVGPIAFLHGDIVWVAAAFLASRLLYAVVALIGAERLFPGSRMRAEPLRRTLVAMRGAWAWAIDAGLGYLNIQIDTLFVVHMLGLSAAGVYQSGARFVQVGIGMSAVLFNIHVPALAAHSEVSVISSRERRMEIEYAVVGVFFALVFWFGGPMITRFLLGPQYTAVNGLWPGFAAFIFGRYVAGAFGVALTAFAAPKIRVTGQVAAIAVIIGGFLLLPKLDLFIVPWLMATGALATILTLGGGRLWLLHKTRNAAKLIGAKA